MAFKQKQKDDKKKLEEAKARAGQKGPMGAAQLILIQQPSIYIWFLYRWWWNKEKWEKIAKLLNVIMQGTTNNVITAVCNVLASCTNRASCACATF